MTQLTVFKTDEPEPALNKTSADFFPAGPNLFYKIVKEDDIDYICLSD
jgi:hypothetical protein